MRSLFTSRERTVMALEHKEPDRIPFDFSSTSATGIHSIAYKNLLMHLEIDKDIEIADMMQQMAKVDEDVLKRLKVDTRGMSPSLPSDSDSGKEEDNNYSYFLDRWGIKYKMPKKGGLYYDMVGHPLSGSISKNDIDNFKFPDIVEISHDLDTLIREWDSRSNPPATILEATEGGFLEIAAWLRGFEDFYIDIASDPELACYLYDKIIEFKMKCWEIALGKIGPYITIAWESDDLGFQDGPMFSPDFYRAYIKPRHKKLFQFIKETAPKKICVAFHSCGSIYDLIPDLIDAGIDAINPVQVSAAKMDTKRLKREFGSDITFWGGGVDTQRVLPTGTPQDVKDEVIKRIDDLAPGGGFIFNPVHNVQADVPPDNFMAMWETFQEFCVY